jgi:hypothetical protein
MSVEVSIRACHTIDMESMVSSLPMILRELLNVKYDFSLEIKHCLCQVDEQFGLVGDDITISWNHGGEVNMHCHNVINQENKTEPLTILSAAPLRTGYSVILLGAISIAYGRLVHELIEDDENLFKTGSPVTPDFLFDKLRNHESHSSIHNACEIILNRIGIQFHESDQ